MNGKRFVKYEFYKADEFYRFSMYSNSLAIWYDRHFYINHGNLRFHSNYIQVIDFLDLCFSCCLPRFHLTHQYKFTRCSQFYRNNIKKEVKTISRFLCARAQGVQKILQLAITNRINANSCNKNKFISSAFYFVCIHDLLPCEFSVEKITISTSECLHKYFTFSFIFSRIRLYFFFCLTLLLFCPRLRSLFARYVMLLIWKWQPTRILDTYEFIPCNFISLIKHKHILMMLNIKCTKNSKAFSSHSCCIE